VAIPTKPDFFATQGFARPSTFQLLPLFSCYHHTMHYQWAHPGTVRISGATRKDYLQRQTSNDMDLLSPTRALPNLLTSASGRILEVFTMVEDGDDLLMITQAGHGPGLAQYFAKRIFFNDQVVIKDESAAWGQAELLGNDAEDTLKQLGFARVPQLDEVLEAEHEGTRLRAIGEAPFGATPRVRLLFPAGAKLSLGETIDFAKREQLRIDAGVAGDPEFQNEYTPFELGLERLVAATKGCYTGQEVLARQVTYDKIVRQLAKVQSDQPLEPKTQLFVEGKAAGQVSSAIGNRGLAVLRKPHHEPGTALTAKIGEQEFPVTVPN
jgi:folate-binding protein YgfZ